MTTSLRSMRVVFAIVALSLVASRSGDAQTILYQIPGTDAGAGPRQSIQTIEIAGAEAVAIGTPDHDEPGLIGAGKVDVFEVRTGVLLYTITGSAAGDSLGVRVTKGDVNGDGVDELIVGADQGGVGGYVDVFNASDGSLLEHVVETSPSAAIGAGINIAIGDLDGDGLNELAIGSPLEDSPTILRAGALHVISSATGADLATIYGDSSDARYGGGVRVSAGDVNGDGVDEIFIGAPGDGGTGSVSCYSGATLQLVWKSSGSAAGDDFGTAGAGLDYDFDGDGIPDLVIGAPRLSSSVPTHGDVYLVSGATGYRVSALAEVDTSEDFFGISVDSGDINFDGIPEVFVGAPGAAGGGVHRGRVVAFQWDTSLAPPAFGQLAEIFGGSDGDGLGKEVYKGNRGLLGSSGCDVAVLVPDSSSGATDGGAVALCDFIGCIASASNYGTGWPGTLGVPGISASNPPSFGASITISIENSSTSATLGLLLLGFAQTSIPTNAGGTILVAPPWLITPLPLPVGQLDAPGSIPIDLTLCGLALDLQCLELDPGASRHLSFTPGLELVLGG